MACPDCNNENADCGCIKDALHISQVCNPVDCSTEECTESFAAGCIVYTGDDILCGTTVLVTSGESIAQALANTIAYFCTTDGIANDILCGEDVIVTAPATINEGLEQVAAYFCTQIDGLNVDIANINNLISIIQADITAIQGDVTNINNTINLIQNELINNMNITFDDVTDIDGCVTRTWQLDLLSTSGIIATATWSTPPICPPVDVCAAPAGTIQNGVTQVVVCNNGDQELVPSDDFAKADDIPQVCSFILTDPNAITDNLVACRNGTDIINISYGDLVNFILEQANQPTDAYGLWTQTEDSTPVTSGTGSLLGNGVGSLTVPAGQFAVGDSFRLSVHGHISSDANQDIVITVRSVGPGTVLATTGTVNIQNNVNDEHFEIKIDFTVRSITVGPVQGSIASAGAFTYTSSSSSTFEGAGFSQVGALLTDGPNTLAVDVEWQTASGGNSIYTELVTLTKMY